MRQKQITPWVLICFPVVAFYALLTRELVDLPFLDDYSGVLGFLVTWIQIKGLGGKLTYILTAQHNEYKIMLANAVFALQYVMCSHVNFVLLSVLGNLFILAVFCVLYAMWRQDEILKVQPLLFFVPTAWMLFQFQYYSLLNWPMSSFQEAAIMVFALLSVYLLGQQQRTNFYWALVCLVLSIASSGNGLFLIPIGALMLLQHRHVARLIGWLAVSLGMVILYFYKYNFNASQSHTDHSTLSSLHHFSFLYALGFLGASIGRYNVNTPVLILGMLFCVVFIVALADRLHQKSPAIFYSMLFILITAFAVSGLRSDAGIDQSMASRYRIYSNLMLIFCYFYILRRWRPDSLTVQARRAAFGIFLSLAVGFNVVSTHAGFKLLRIRSQGTIEGISRWEHGETPITEVDKGPDEDPVIRRQRLNGNFAPQEPYLTNAIAKGIYEPRQY